MKFVLYFVWCIISISLSFAQDCKTPGESCDDDKQCCGGCCIQGKCIQTYHNCEEVSDPCVDDDSYCGPGFECHMYPPSPGCVGCSMQRVCRPFKDPGSGNF